MAEEPAGPGGPAPARASVAAPTSNVAAFLQGGGELGALIRAKDWSRTPLGPPETWPQSLKTTLGILLNSRYPMFVFWGPELIKIYNDGYRPITGHKHPWALGRPAREVWPEIWSDIEPLVARALSVDPTYSDDLMLFMERSGFREEVYFTFSYSPVPDESGGVGGMFCACTETTARVIGERRLRTLRDLAVSPADARAVDVACLRSTERAGGEHGRRPVRPDLPAATGRRPATGRTTGVAAGDAAAPVEGADDDAIWPIAPVTDRHRRARHRPAERIGAVPGGRGPSRRRRRWCCRSPTAAWPQRRRDRAGRQRASPVRRRVPRWFEADRRPDQRGDRQRARRSRTNGSEPRRWRSSIAPRPRSSRTSATSSARR